MSALFFCIANHHTQTQLGATNIQYAAIVSTTCPDAQHRNIAEKYLKLCRTNENSRKIVSGK